MFEVGRLYDMQSLEGEKIEHVCFEIGSKYAFLAPFTQDGNVVSIKIKDCIVFDTQSNLEAPEPVAVLTITNEAEA